MIYDVIIVGGGPGGYVAAIKASQMGGVVLLIEKEHLGGVCLNKGCIPTKALLKCSGMYKSMKNAEQFGISTGEISLDFSRMMKRKQQVVDTLVNGIKGLMKSSRIEVIAGEGRILDSSRVEVGTDVYEGKNIIIATGSKPFMPSIKGIASKNVLSSDEMLSISSLPASIVIIGGGVIGIEFGVILSELGCNVTIIEMLDDILAMADIDIIKEAKNILEKNIKIITSAKVTEITEGGVLYVKDGKECRIGCEKILVAVGRVPNIDRNELDRLGIRHNNGKIETDDKLRTNVKGIYAIGDVNGKYMLAHVASEEGIVAVENIFGKDAKMSYKAIPQCVYSHPEAAWVGMTEKEAGEKNIDISIGKFPISFNGKSLAEGETAGFIKVIVDRKYNEILGVHMLCSHATDMISEATLSLNLEATVKELATSIHPHPTVSEALMEAALAAIGRAIHSTNIHTN